MKKNYASAVPLLLSGFDVVNNQEVTAENNLIKYKLLKNLGWARLGQKRYADAKASLQEAIDLDDRSAPGYCLMAQVLEGEKSWSQALKVWKKCLIFATSINPDEDYWVSLARQRLEKGDSKP